MAKIKLTKNELRLQQKRLTQLERYLPTLQLKKAMLQQEVANSRLEIEKLERDFDKRYRQVQTFSALYSDKDFIDWQKVAKPLQVNKRYENIAGVEIPHFEGIVFAPLSYTLFDTPVWLDTAVSAVYSLSELRARVAVEQEKKEALERELREVSIRVNLFEKVLIPRAKANIRHIRVFLGDQELAAVGRAKVAKSKIEMRRQLHKIEAEG